MRSLFFQSLFVFGLWWAVGGWWGLAEPKQGVGKGGGHGRMSDQDRATIHSLFVDHEKIDRRVEVIPAGYRSTTTSKDPEVAKRLREHVKGMEARLESGKGVRRWDPAFAELREHYEDMEISVKAIEGGVMVVVKGRTPAAVEVARNHARIITGFVEKGESRMHATHPAVGKREVPDDSAPANESRP